MDNLKWTRGYTARFGTVDVDCATQKQIIKDFQLLVQKVDRGAFLSNGGRKYVRIVERIYN